MLCTLLPSAHACVCRLLAVCLAVFAAYTSNFVIVFVKRGVLTLLECDAILQRSVPLFIDYYCLTCEP